MIFHDLNRGDARDQNFGDDSDEAAFEFYAHGQSHDFPLKTESHE